MNPKPFQRSMPPEMQCAFCGTTRRDMELFAQELGVEISDTHCCDGEKHETIPTFDIGWAA